MTDATTLDMSSFWGWLVNHPNCILRVGTPEAVLYDDDDLHWQFATEGSETLVVQCIRGKRLAGEILIAPDQIAYVEGVAGDQDGEYVFELMSESETERLVAYYFVLTHGLEETEETDGRRVH